MRGIREWGPAPAAPPRLPLRNRTGSQTTRGPVHFARAGAGAGGGQAEPPAVGRLLGVGQDIAIEPFEKDIIEQC
jgi:hypothetical protein